MDLLINIVLPIAFGGATGSLLIYGIEKEVSRQVKNQNELIGLEIENNNRSIDLLLKANIEHDTRLKASCVLIQRLTDRVKTLEQVNQEQRLQSK